MSNNNHTFRLFRKIPTYISGVASTLDFFGDESLNYRTDSTDEKADSNSIYADWLAVGDDMRFALKNHGDETAQRKS